MKRRTKTPIVTVWDPTTDTFSEIPKPELAPGMIRVDLDKKGLVWVQQDQLHSHLEKNKPFLHPRLGDEFAALFAEIKASIDPYYHKTAEEWEDGFRMDSDPEQEIANWLWMARKMKKFADGAATPRNREVFQVLLAALNNGPENALLTVQLEHLTKSEAAAILAPEG